MNFDIVGAILKPVGDYFNKRQEIKAQQHENEMKLLEAQGERQAQLVKEGLAADATWELEQVKQQADSWKDELVLVVLSLPLVLVFVPATQQTILNGFAALATTPDWFRWLVIMIYAATYGIRVWRRAQSDT